jgi:F420-dependent oxidoreductase-like protein
MLWSASMKLGLILGYSGPEQTWNADLVLEAERLGFDSVWAPESYGSDAVTPLAWLAGQTRKIRLGTGIMQMPARTPAMTAMTAMTLQHLSGGRFMLGLGLSGPQVVEGWHGLPYGKPLARTREYVSIIRKVIKREAPLEFDGKEYQIPYRGPGATGLGQPLKSILHGRPDLPIYIAAIGPKNTALAAEIADGWIPTQFAARHFHVFEASLNEGFAKAGGGKSLRNFEIAASVPVSLGPDVQACRDACKPRIALYVGGMGARDRNFYHDLICRYGYQAQADNIQALYLDGKRKEAIAAVPDTLVDDLCLCGPKERIRDRFSAWKAIPISTLNLREPTAEVMRTMAEIAA